MSDKGSENAKRTEKARVFRQLWREKRENAKLARSRGRLLQQQAASTPTSPQRPHFSNTVTLKEHIDLEQRVKMLTILEDMTANSSVPPSRRRYTVTTLLFAFAIATTSFTCYQLLRRFLFLPSYSILFRYFQPQISETERYITDLNMIPQYLESLADQMGEEKEKMRQYGGILAVDAMSLRPHVFVTKDGLVQGVLENTLINNTEMMKMKERYEAYERYVASLKNKTITDSFVYQYQPLYAKARCFTVFIEPSTQGKATGVQIDRLSELAEHLTAHGFPVEGFAFDGDSTYSQLHSVFFTNYQRFVTADASFWNFSVINSTSIVSDPLHLLKRARYRLLQSKVHGNFENTTDSLISVEHLQSQFNLPSVVFCNESYTKMHDELATRLFSLSTLASLFQRRNLTELTYFLPICLLSASLHENNLGTEERVNLLEVGFYYMMSYYNMLSDHPIPLTQRKTKGNQHVCPFDLTFVREYCNTVCSILKVLYRSNDTIGLNRIGSNPVEHLFGLIRMKSHSVHTYEKALSVLSKSTLQRRFIEQVGENERIDKRLSDFARDVDCSTGLLAKNSLGMNARDLAFSLHCSLGLPVNVANLMVWDATSLFELRDEIFENFRSQVLLLAERCRAGKTHRLTSSDLKVTTGGQIKSRLADKSVLS